MAGGDFDGDTVVVLEDGDEPVRTVKDDELPPDAGEDGRFAMNNSYLKDAADNFSQKMCDSTNAYLAEVSADITAVKGKLRA